MFITSFNKLISEIQVGQVYRYWYGTQAKAYVKVRDSVPCEYACEAGLGIPADNEIEEDGVHFVNPILAQYFSDPEFRIELITNQEEIAGKKFSYDNLKRSK